MTDRSVYFHDLIILAWEAASSEAHLLALAGPIHFLTQLAGVLLAVTDSIDEQATIPSHHWNHSSASVVELVPETALLHQIYRSSLFEMFRESTYISSKGMGGALVYSWKTS